VNVCDLGCFRGSFVFGFCAWHRERLDRLAVRGHDVALDASVLFHHDVHVFRPDARFGVAVQGEIVVAHLELDLVIRQDALHDEVSVASRRRVQLLDPLRVVFGEELGALDGRAFRVDYHALDGVAAVELDHDIAVVDSLLDLHGAHALLDVVARFDDEVHGAGVQALDQELPSRVRRGGRISALLDLGLAFVRHDDQASIERLSISAHDFAADRASQLEDDGAQLEALRGLEVESVAVAVEVLALF
jgi:hypothetical protein